MAINKKIIEKIKEKSDSELMKKNIINVLKCTEEGRQPKRVIRNIINTVTRS